MQSNFQISAIDPLKKDDIRIITWSTLMEDDIHESVFDCRKTNNEPLKTNFII